MNRKALKYRILQIFQNLGFVRKRIIARHFLGKNYRVVEGTFRDTPEKDESWLFNVAKYHKVIFDIGANIGQSAFLMLYHETVEKIVLVDPNPEALALAAENLIMNGLSPKAYFIPAFLSNQSGEKIEFYTVLSGAAGSKFKSFAQTANKLNAHFTVSTLTVDELCASLNLYPSLVKVDVEGAEMDVLNGAVKLAKMTRPLFFVEIHSGPELSITENTQNILTWCQHHGYQAWYLRLKKPLTKELIKERGGFHALLLPENCPFPEYLLKIEESESIRLVS